MLQIADSATAVENSPTRGNVATWLSQRAAERPEQAAIILTAPAAIRRAGRTTLSFVELDSYSNRLAQGLVRLGLRRGERVLLMVKPGFEFIGLTFALFKLGAVPVMIDPGMGIRRLAECIRGVDLDAFVGIPQAHLLRFLKPRAFRGVKRFVTVGSRWFWGGATLEQLAKSGGDFQMVDTRATDPAAILFTSGSTGPAKGVVYEHGMFDAQIRMIQSHYGMEPGEVDLPTFPLFGLFSLAMGMTVVIPDMDASRPARVDPAKIVDAIKRHRATNTFGSPALWDRVGDYCRQRGVKLPTLRRVLIAGAPVARRILERIVEALPSDADVHTPYGATESLPVSSIGGRERIALAQTAAVDAGTCVGRPLPDADVRLIRISDEPIAQWSDDLLVPDGEVGEIVVAGGMVTREYYGLPRATESAKILDGDRVWHRIGDVGRRDAQGRLWYCGRKSHRVTTRDGVLFTECVEPMFRQHPDVARCALVGVGPAGDQTPVLVVEPHPGRFPRGPRADALAEELRQIARSVPTNRQSTIGNWQSVPVLFHPRLPVDIRHNAKINREALALWAARRLA